MAVGWSIPNPTGIPGVFEVYCPDEIKECVTLQAQYIYDAYGKFPATIPSVFLLTYLQAQHIDLDFYDHYLKLGSYLSTHTNHMRKRHYSGTG
jgi:hypothetical protein